MNKLLTLIILTLSTLGCANKQTSKAPKTPVTAPAENRDTIFRQVADFPTIKDTAKFIADLRQTFELGVDESPGKKLTEKITTFKKVKIYGSDKDYIFIEYDYGYGCGAAFPWKYQILLTT